MNNSDEHWLDVLAGKKPEGVDDDTKREAEKLRNKLLLNIFAAQDELTIERNKIKLIERLKIEGLIKKEKTLFNKYLLSAMAASLVIAVITLNIVINTKEMIPDVSENYYDYPVYRSVDKIKVINSNDAAGLKEEFKLFLHKSGLPYKIIKTDKGWYLEFNVIKNNQRVPVSLIQKYHLEIDQNDWVRVNIHKQ